MKEINKPMPSSNVKHVIGTAAKRKVTMEQQGASPLHYVNLIRLLTGVGETT